MCYCGRPWNSILPPPPCEHTLAPYKRAGVLPEHYPFGRWDLIKELLLPEVEYVGKHRKPE